jgi:hypothetical protein
LSLLLLAKDNGFSEEKLSTFFSIVLLLHDNSVQKDWDSAAAYSWLKSTVMQHSVKSEHGAPVFAAADVRVVTDFAIKGYIQHLLLYKFCFTKPQPEDTCGLPTTPHTSHLTPHTSHLTPHTSHLTPHASHLTPHASHSSLPGLYHHLSSSSDIPAGALFLSTSTKLCPSPPSPPPHLLASAPPPPRCKLQQQPIQRGRRCRAAQSPLPPIAQPQRRTLPAIPCKRLLKRRCSRKLPL